MNERLIEEITNMIGEVQADNTDNDNDTIVKEIAERVLKSVGKACRDTNVNVYEVIETIITLYD